MLGIVEIKGTVQQHITWFVGTHLTDDLEEKKRYVHRYGNLQINRFLYIVRKLLAQNPYLNVVGNISIVIVIMRFPVNTEADISTQKISINTVRFGEK